MEKIVCDAIAKTTVIMILATFAYGLLLAWVSKGDAR